MGFEFCPVCGKMESCLDIDCHTCKLGREHSRCQLNTGGDCRCERSDLFVEIDKLRAENRLLHQILERNRDAVRYLKHYNRRLGDL